MLIDRAGPGQALTRAVIGLERLLTERGFTVTIRWARAHKGVKGNEVADSRARRATEARHGPVD